MIVQVKECCLIHHLACSVRFGKGRVSHSYNNSSRELSGGAGKAHTYKGSSVNRFVVWVGMSR